MLTQKNVNFQSNNNCEKSFQELKNHLVSVLVLTLPPGIRGYVFYTDAFRKGLSWVGLQTDQIRNGYEHILFRILF